MISEKLQSFVGLILGLYSFEDFKCFESWAQYLRWLFTLTQSTVRRTMAHLLTLPNGEDTRCVIQTSESAFYNRIEDTGKRVDLAYRQIWLYAMRKPQKVPVYNS